MDKTPARQPLYERRTAISHALREGIPGSAAVQGVIDRWQRQHESVDEWDDWLDGDEHSDSDADDDDGDGD